MTQNPDILVLGLGPAGASAARAAALAGYSVLAVERKTEPGTPVQCAEFVPAMIGAEVSALVDTTIQSISSMVTQVEQEPADITPNFPGRMIDRARFDHQLANDAAAAGAQTRYGINARDISTGGDIDLSDGSHISAKVLIGADGPHSLVGMAIGSTNDEILETRQINVPLLQPFDSTDIFLKQDIPGGYAWAFPKGGTVNLGLGVEASAKDQLKPLLEDLHRQLVAEGRVGAQINSYTGGAIPAGGLLKPYRVLGGTMCLLAGDAAGLTNPITGAGINSAVISGKLAGEAAAQYLAGDMQAAENYQEDLTDLFGPSLTRALAHRTRMAHILQNHKTPDPEQLRSGWIAYSTYWEPIISAQTEEIPCPA
ncbi:MAG: geranylgeranyl reductase [Robiginitomaculum sp.]|nr:MAG: geranylgeranyl reductase [Robiginitomaculum sp.]